MATPSRPSTASGRLRTKTSELSDLFRGRQHSSVPSPPADASSKAKRKIPLFSLRKKSPAAANPRRSPTPPHVPTPRPSTNAPTPSPAGSSSGEGHLPKLTIPPSSFSPLPTFDDASTSKRSSGSPTYSRSTRSVTRTPSSHSPNTVTKSRTPTPTSAITLGGSSFSDSEPPRSANARTPTAALLRSYASDDEERRYLSARNIPPGKPAPTKALPPPPDGASFSTAYPTPTTPTTPPISFPSPAAHTSDAKLPTPNVRKFAVSTSAPRSPSFRFTSGSESASESAYGYTSASGSESATTGLGLGFRIRTKSGHGNSSDASRAASVRVGLLRAPNSLTGPRVTSPPPPKTPPVSLTRSSPPAVRTSLERAGSPRSVPPSQSSMKRVSPPIPSATSKSSSEGPTKRQTEPTSSSTKHASWLVIPKAASTSPPGQAGGQDTKTTAPSKFRARAASDSRTLTTANAASQVGSSSSLQAPTTAGASAQSITATRSSSALAATSPPNLLKSPSTAAAPPSNQPNRVASGTNSPPPTEPLPKLPRPSLSRTSSEISQQASTPSSGSPSSSESSTRTLTLLPSLLSTSNAVSGSGTVGGSVTGSSNTLGSSPSGPTTASAVRSVPSALSATGNVRRSSSKDERPVIKDKSKDTTWPSRSASKRSSPTVSSPLAQSHTSQSPPYASPSSFSASTSALSTSPSPQPPPSRAIVPIPPTPANIFALQTENADLRSEIASLRAQLESADRLARRREREIRGLRWLVINWGGDKKDTFAFATSTERRPGGDTTESQEEVQAAVRYLRAESESGYGSGSTSGCHERMSHSSAYSSVYPAESVSDGSGSELSAAQRVAFGPGPSARASEDHALDAIPERTTEDTEAAEAERRRKKEERRASRALKRISTSTISDSHGSGLDEIVSQAMHTGNLAHGRAMSIEQVIEGDRARRERVGLKGMDEVLDKLRAVAGVDPGGGTGVKTAQ